MAGAKQATWVRATHVTVNCKLAPDPTKPEITVPHRVMLRTADVQVIIDNPAGPFVHLDSGHYYQTAESYEWWMQMFHGPATML